MFRIKSLLFIVLIVTLCLAVPVFAQETTPEVQPTNAPPVVIVQPPVVETPELAWSRTEIALTGALFIMTVGLMFFAGSLVVLSKRLLEAAPPWVADLIRENVPAVLAEGERIVLTTPNAFDDALWAEFDRRTRRILFEAGLFATPVGVAATPPNPQG
jgi:hypothetical protein